MPPPTGRATEAGPSFSADLALSISTGWTSWASGGCLPRCRRWASTAFPVPGIARPAAGAAGPSRWPTSRPSWNATTRGPRSGSPRPATPPGAMTSSSRRGASSMRSMRRPSGSTGMRWRICRRTSPIQEGRQFDIRHYHMGALDVRGRDKLLAQLLRRGGVPAVRQKVRLAHGSVARSPHPILVTGGAGFIGSNIADALLARGEEVIIFDNFSREGSSLNIDWLRDRHGKRAVVHAADIRDAGALAEAAEAAAAVIHLAAQVAVTESLVAPLEDFTINAGGTLHLLEALRRKSEPTPLIMASTNKVYGDLAHIRDEAARGSLSTGRPGAGRVRHRREPKAGPRDALRVLQGRRRSIRARLCTLLRAAHGRDAHELHLRPASVRHRGSGLGGALPDAGGRRRADHDLRRRPAGAGRPSRPGRGSRLSAACSSASTS